MHRTSIAIGSNLGNRLGNCQAAVKFLDRIAGVRIVATSLWYRAKALTADDRPQPDYCNGVVAIETARSPHDLLTQLRAIEVRLGRPSPRERWAARSIDLDMLLYDDCIVHDDAISLPHPEMAKRLFVLEPLCAIAPDAVHPELCRTITALLAEYRERHPDERLAVWKEEKI